ncbi:MAG: hypothetical protein KDA91_05545 [Planctomycetaceae bacterium]|nr:hypothetical protein [Planctomycetaceae bacterium]
MTSTHDCQLNTANSAASLRQRLGCWVNERWKTELILGAPAIAARLGLSWKDLCNRREQIEIDQQTQGRVCHWADSSPLTVSRIFPQVGARLLQNCLRESPVNFNPTKNGASTSPDVSFVLGVRGTGRLPQFLATVQSLLGQQDCESEVVVVEQSWKQEFQNIVPEGVRYLHTPATSADMPFNRSWALNAGAVNARGRVVVLHDGDYVVPTHFAKEVSQRVAGNVQSARLARLIFYFDQSTSEQIQQSHSLAKVRSVSRIVQNNPTPMALTKEAYLAIGGHDESFYGWGGEDNEFLDRARTLNHCEGAFLPVFHLWHPEAPNRSGDRNANRLTQIMDRSPHERIQQLTSRPFGQLTPQVTWKPA